VLPPLLATALMRLVWLFSLCVLPLVYFLMAYPWPVVFAKLGFAVLVSLHFSNYIPVFWIPAIPAEMTFLLSKFNCLTSRSPITRAITAQHPLSQDHPKHVIPAGIAGIQRPRMATKHGMGLQSRP
jgi:hypothetical protein